MGGKVEQVSGGSGPYTRWYEREAAPTPGGVRGRRPLHQMVYKGVGR